MSEVKSIKSILYQREGIDVKQILFKKDDAFRSTVPDTLKKSHEVIMKKWTEKEEQNTFRNQDNLCISQFHLKANKLFLNFCEEKYIMRQGLAETIGTIPFIQQDFLISEINHGKAKIPVTYKVNIVIITKDNKLLVVKRSDKVSSNKNRFDLGVSKGVKPSDYKGKAFQPLATAIRAMKEEVGVSLDIKEVIASGAFQVKEFYLNREIFSLAFCCVIDLRKLAADYTFEKVSSLASGAKNSWEYSSVISLDLSKKAITKFIKDNNTKVTNYSLHNLLQILHSL